MDAIWGSAVQIPFVGVAGGSFVGGPYRGVLHTTEAKDFNPSTTSYYSHSDPPHFTLALKDGEAKIYQHYSIKVAARALVNLPGGVETNRRSAIQIEIAWTAADIANLPAPMMLKLKDWMRWVEQQCGVKQHAPTFHGPEAYGHGSIARMSADEWNGFDGWCGHQHVPENDHWDPGKIAIATLF